MKPATGSKNRFRAMLVIWGYDVVKLLVIFKVIQGYGINPWVFFFLDMVTVPTYVMGWSRLMSSLTGEIRTFRAVFAWGLITFVSSTAPYLYAAVAGRQSFPAESWLILAVILLFLTVNLIRKISRTKKDTCLTDI